MKKILLLLLLCASLKAQTTIQYTYTLPSDQSAVTIGVKDQSGALIRTISTGFKNAGTYTGIWDGLTDLGAPASNGPYRIFILYGNPRYTWDGVFFNTSPWFGWDRWNNTGLWIGRESLSVSTRMTFIGDTIWKTHGGAEGTIAVSQVTKGNPGVTPIVFPSYSGQNLSFNDIANDGQFLYASSSGYWPTTGVMSFVTKLDGATGQPHMFTNGVTTKGGVLIGGPSLLLSWNGTNMSSINPSGPVLYNGTTILCTTAAPQPPTAIAVQQNGTGNLLAVAHGNYRSANSALACGVANPITQLVTNNQILFFDKTTGAAVGTIATIANPQSMAFDPSGNLWVIASNGAAGATQVNMIANPGGANTITQPITGLSNPAYLDVNAVVGQPTSGHIYVLDGGNNQQLFEYDPGVSLSTPVRTFGKAGGYSDPGGATGCDPTVAHNKLMVDFQAVTGTKTIPQEGSSSWVRVDGSGDAWIGEKLDNNGYGRLQHLTPSGTTFNYVSQVLFTTNNYWMTVSHSDPTRAFYGLLEFKVRYDVPNQPGDPEQGNQSWMLVKNWLVGQGGACGSSAAAFTPMTYSTFFQAVETLSNGRTYGALDNANHVLYQLELPASGPARQIGPAPVGTSYFTSAMDRNGNYRQMSFSPANASSTGNTGNLQWFQMTGFGGPSGADPQYANGLVTITSWNYNQGIQPPPGGFWGNAQVSLEPSASGAIMIGANGFAAMMTTSGFSLPSLTGTGTLYSNVGPKFGTHAIASATDSLYITIPPYTVPITSNSNWTMEAWLKTASAGTQVAVSMGNATSYAWMGSVGGQFAASISGFNSNTPMSSGITINDGAWHHCALAVSSAGNIAALFVDGVQQNTAGVPVSYSGNTPSISNLGLFGAVGRFSGATGMSWTGGIDEVAFWRSARYAVAYTVPTAAYVGNETNITSLFHLDNNNTQSGAVNNLPQFTTGIPHVAIVVPGRSSYLATMAPEVCSPFLQTNASYPSCVNTNNGAQLYTEGHNMIASFCLQAENVGPQFWHYWDDGMLVAQWSPWNNTGITGANGPYATIGNTYNPALGFRGYWPQIKGLVYNCGAGKVVTVNGDLYDYVTTEQNFGPAQRWHISNLASLHEIASPPAALGGSVIVNQNIFAAQAVKKAAASVLRHPVEHRQDRRQP